MRLVDLAHPARAEERIDAIGAKDSTRPKGSATDGQGIPDNAGPFVSGQEGIDVGAQREIRAAGLEQIRRTLIGRAIQRAVKDLRHDAPAFRSHKVDCRSTILPGGGGSPDFSRP